MEKWTAGEGEGAKDVDCQLSLETFTGKMESVFGEDGKNSLNNQRECSE